MTVKELKEKINSIPETMDDMPVVIERPDYNDYCLGDGMEEVTTIDVLRYDRHRENNPAAWLEFHFY